MHQIQCTISGKVQMVMFRDFVRRNAKALGIVGSVRNKEDGTVEVIAQGEKESLEKLIKLLHKGPFLAHVVRVDVAWGKLMGDFNSFTIVYS